MCCCFSLIDYILPSQTFRLLLLFILTNICTLVDVIYRAEFQSTSLYLRSKKTEKNCESKIKRNSKEIKEFHLLWTLRNHPRKPSFSQLNRCLNDDGKLTIKLKCNHCKVNTLKLIKWNSCHSKERRQIQGNAFFP